MQKRRPLYLSYKFKRNHFIFKPLITPLGKVEKSPTYNCVRSVMEVRCKINILYIIWLSILIFSVMTCFNFMKYFDKTSNLKKKIWIMPNFFISACSQSATISFEGAKNWSNVDPPKKKVHNQTKANLQHSSL